MISWSNHKVLLSFTYNKLLITVRSMEVVFHGRTSESYHVTKLLLDQSCHEHLRKSLLGSE